MSKKAKAKSRLIRLNKKRGAKASNQRKYEAYIDAGNNTKSKRNRRAGAKKIVKDRNHAIDYCGNLSCSSCFPRLNDIWLVSKASCLYSKRFTSGQNLVK